MRPVKALNLEVVNGERWYLAIMLAFGTNKTGQHLGVTFQTLIFDPAGML